MQSDLVVDLVLFTNIARWSFRADLTGSTNGSNVMNVQMFPLLLYIFIDFSSLLKLIYIFIYMYIYYTH